MKRFGSVGFVFLSLFLSPPLVAIEITDDLGVTSSFAIPPQRVISLLPSLTETVCVLKQCQKLVGVDRYSNWPASIKSLPIVGGGLDPNIEAIAMLKPDVVLVGKSSRATDRLRSLGIKVLTFDVKDYRSTQLAITKIALILGLPDKEAELIWQNIISQVSLITASLPKNSQGMRVYFEVSNTPFGAGESSFIGETLSRLKVTNIIPSSLGPFPKLNPEFIVRENPNLIMLGYTANENLSARPGWNKIQAVSQQRICSFSPEEIDVLSRPSPRIPEAAQIMANCLIAQTSK
ncbi:ABC transporter substrate-binding protein [Polynucleobacter sp. IMCC 29146]|uniref:ABC transporter substrate-binding protein n=1 Tax=Polynucleobacter sp. IMCC 29146 TaxID=2780953 RepID=UPI001F1F2A0B|nr:helical backbone metal receptor [Polynucleobacter sp. IMCC 29146]MCE7529981.1 helical backbone metal receptor [Polynucleobacter sp. IMCC 29146]